MLPYYSNGAFPDVPFSSAPYTHAVIIYRERGGCVAQVAERKIKTKNVQKMSVDLELLLVSALVKPKTVSPVE